MSAAHQPSLLTSPVKTRPTRAPLMPPHATPEDMDRPREVLLHLMPNAAQQGFVGRVNTTPFSAMAAFLPRLGPRAEALCVSPGEDPADVEIRLTAAAAGEGPQHMLGLISEGMTLDEARKALAQLARLGL